MPVKSYQPLIHPRWLPSGSFHQPFARPILFFPPTGRKHPRNDLNPGFISTERALGGAQLVAGSEDGVKNYIIRRVMMIRRITATHRRDTGGFPVPVRAVPSRAEPSRSPGPRCGRRSAEGRRRAPSAGPAAELQRVRGPSPPRPGGAPNPLPGGYRNSSAQNHNK